MKATAKVASISAGVSTKNKNEKTSSSSKGQKLHLALSPCLFHMFWWIVIWIHLLLAVTSSGIAILYVLALPEDSFIRLSLPYFGMIIDPKATFATIVCMSCFAMWHLYLIGLTFYTSYQAKQLAFPAKEDEQTPNQSNRSTASAPRSGFTRAMSQIRVFQTIVVETKQLLGVQGKYFEVAFVIRETTEILLQTYQAYTLSHAGPNLFLNRLFAAVVVVNCWSTPLLHYLLRHYRAFKRFLCLGTDLVLDVCSCTVIPFLLFLPYYKAYDLSMDDLWYDPKWMVIGRSELGMIHLAQWTPLLTQILPRLSIIMCLQTMTSLVVKKKSSVVPVPNHRNSTKKDHWYHSQSLILRLFHGIFILFGAFVLCMHLISTKTLYQNVDGCSSRLFPWLMIDPRPVCAVFEVNCYRNSHLSNAGRAEEIDQVLQNVYTEAVVYLGINHCEQLSIPKSIQDLKSLYWFEIYNSTLYDWPEEAAVTQEKHKELTSLYLIQVNLITPGIPTGMVSNTFPEAIVDMQISHTNLNFLPEKLGEYWPQAFETLILEYCGFEIFPNVINDLTLSRYVSLAGNNFSEIPENSLVHKSIHQLSLARNPIGTLPASMAMNQFGFLFLDETNLTTLPDWIDEIFFENTWLNAVNTPFCEQLLSTSASSSSSTEIDKTSNEAAVGGGLICDETIWFEFPIVPIEYYKLSRSLDL